MNTEKQMTYTKTQLLEMNTNRTLGFNWIRNINDIAENAEAKIYPTGDAGWSGRYYVALPATTELTQEIILKYNIWI